MTLGNALGYPPELSGCAGLSAFAGTLVYMTIAGQGITGMPGFNAPIDVRVLFITPCLVLIANMVLEAKEGTITYDFWIFYAAAVLVPQLMGAKARSEGWMTPVLAKDAPRVLKQAAAPASKSRLSSIFTCITRKKGEAPSIV